MLSLAAGFAAMTISSQSARAVTSVNLDFNGSGNTLAATGFDNVYTIDPTHFNVGAGRLTIMTQGGDTFGNYENDPDTAKNMFFSNIDALGATVAEAHVRVSSLNVNFHGGGIWMGTDQDHYFRLGIFNNSFEGGVAAEGLRENEDRWVNAIPPGPGDDIVGRVIGNIQPSPQQTPIDAVLRIVRLGPTVQGFVSTDNGVTFQQVGGPGFTFTGFATPGDPQSNGSNTQENLAQYPASFKVGVYAFGGPDPQTPGVFEFDNFVANSFVPEPATIGLIGLAGLSMLRRRVR